MTRAEFISEFTALLELPAGSLTPETVMAELEGWDSVAYLTAMVMIDEQLAITITPDVLSKSETFGGILDAVQGALSG